LNLEPPKGVERSEAMERLEQLKRLERPEGRPKIVTSSVTKSSEP
jgi:hypothetical protein